MLNHRLISMLNYLLSTQTRLQPRPRPRQDGAERPGDRGGRGQDGQARPRGARAHGRGVRGAVLQEGARVLPARPVGPRFGDTQGDTVPLLY